MSTLPPDTAPALPTLPEGPLDLRLVLVDMDGTLLDEHGEVPEPTWAMIDRLRERGIVFAPASGRQLHTLTAAFERVAEGMVFVAENGCLVVRDGEEISSTVLDTPFVLDVLDTLDGLVADGHDLGVVVCGKASAYVSRTDEKFWAEASRYYARLTAVDDQRAVLDGSAGIEDEIVKIAVYSFEDVEKEVAPALLHHRDPHQVVVSGHAWVDLMPPGANKGVAVRALQSSLGVTPAQTAAFGDYLNDLEMLRAVDLSFAMAEAHPAVVEAAAYRAPSFRDHGVLTVLEELLARLG
ncbi:Cof-type HAD-IIB family hydrolase [Nocardioides bruguierae]|uniref:Cof-type HAD-IIB family hydrolase n=1 Tax=Nocardioides bruguierae TaxID=2945102 RepID=A0A9X2IEV0_9ACTN|nr:Cof-type HAD-IIB family hydrolase [Nocardioides bruguierae]MCM0621201.1 Cof-type HAD-IIB family hydrolase [Nocardioides bruguierae]